MFVVDRCRHEVLNQRFSNPNEGFDARNVHDALHKEGRLVFRLGELFCAMLSPELVFLHHCVGFYLGIATESEQTIGKWLKRVVSILCIAFHLQSFQEFSSFQQDKHVVFG